LIGEDDVGMQRDYWYESVRAADDFPTAAYVAYVNVDDIDGLYAEFVSRGVLMRIPPETKPWGMREFALQTPDGHRMTFGSSVG
jgi:uncharacterized glyoxalase superfamily protein PhnB